MIEVASKMPKKALASSFIVFGKSWKWYDSKIIVIDDFHFIVP